MITKVFPFAAAHSMGWGLELEWFDFVGGGARLGIIDVVAVRHLRPVGNAYPKREEEARLRALMRARGLSSLRDIQRTVGTWRAWHARPPWSAQ